VAAPGGMATKRGVFTQGKEKQNQKVLGNLLTNKPFPNGSE
jgi:hypothetical protein